MQESSAPIPQAEAEAEGCDANLNDAHAKIIQKAKMQLVNQFDESFDAFRPCLQQYPGHDMLRLIAGVFFECAAKIYRDSIYNAPMTLEKVDTLPIPVSPFDQDSNAESAGARESA